MGQGNSDKVMYKQPRRRIWRHNSFLGHTAMARQNMRAIASADSVTPEAQELAYSIEGQLVELARLLAVRVDPS